MNLYQKLVEIRKAVSYLQKDTEGYKYNYVSGSNVLGHIKETMNDLGILFWIEIANDEDTQAMVSQIGDDSSDDGSDDMEFIFNGVATCVWKDAESDEELRVPFYCTGKQNDPSKAFGSALTYTERYFLLKFLNIATDDDDPDAFQAFIDRTTTEVEKKTEKKEVKAPVKKAKKPAKKAAKEAIEKVEKVVDKVIENGLDEETVEKMTEAFASLSMTLEEASAEALDGKPVEEWNEEDKETLSELYESLANGEDDENLKEPDPEPEAKKPARKAAPEKAKKPVKAKEPATGLDEETMTKIKAAFGQFDITIEDIEISIAGKPASEWTLEDKESIGEMYEHFDEGTADPSEYKAE